MHLCPTPSFALQVCKKSGQALQESIHAQVACANEDMPVELPAKPRQQEPTTRHTPSGRWPHLAFGHAQGDSVWVHAHPAGRRKLKHCAPGLLKAPPDLAKSEMSSQLQRFSSATQHARLASSHEHACMSPGKIVDIVRLRGAIIGVLRTL